MSSFKVVVITGASSGIGKAIALALSKQPTAYRLVLAARNKEQLNAVASACGGPDVALVVPTDVTKREEVKALLAASAAKWGRIDVLVNNAGVGIEVFPTALADSDIDRMMAVNVKSALYGMQEVLPYFEANGGQVVNVSSMLARVPVFPGNELACAAYGAYSAAKAYLTSLTDTFRAELKSKNPKVVVTSFFPGPVDTPFATNAGSATPSSEIPGAQNVDEVATVFVEEVIQKAREEVYTRPAYKEVVTGYLAAAHSK